MTKDKRTATRDKRQGTSGRRKSLVAGRLSLCLLLVACCLSLLPAESGSGTSSEGALDIRPRDVKPPRLGFTAELTGANSRDIFVGGTRAVLAVNVTNSGEGPAQGVTIALSGSSGLVGLFSSQHLLGTIAAGASQFWADTVPLPPGIAAETAGTFVVKVQESRPEWSCPDQWSKDVVVQPQPGRGGSGPGPVKVNVPPPRSFTDENAVAAVIGITRYRDPSLRALDFAQLDAEVVKDYLQNVCGVKPENVYALYADTATKGDIDELLTEKLPRKMNTGSTVFIYFSGHGTTINKTEPALMPYDASAGSEAKVFPLSRITELAKAWPARRTLVMVDACYMGTNRSAIELGRPGTRPDLSGVGASDKCVVLSASGESETANDLPEVKHGLFTYYLLRGLRGEAASSGEITLGGLYDYLRKNVPAEAAAKLYKEQTPVLAPAGIEQKAQGWKLGRCR